jgi:hypothetical protein
MKIVFLCGCLEQGRDGVGDYVRRIAVELTRQGHTAAAVSLNDKNVHNTFSGTQSCEEVAIPVLRLPAALNTTARFTQAEKWINEFDPEWISLQFVPFSFHPKGLSFALSNLLKGIGKNRKWHIMFHELWVGMEINARKKYVLLGWLQHWMIRRIIKKLKPKVIHTQTRLYQKQLEKIGFKSDFLPLFSNIPSLHRSNNVSPIGGTNGSINKVSFVVFGGIHSNIPLQEFAEEISVYSESRGGEIAIKFIGQSGAELERWLDTLKSKNVRVEVFGEQSPERISEVLNNSSFGIATTPIALIEKSGSFAAMQEHGLPVICVSNPWYAKGFNDPGKPARVREYKPGNFMSCLQREQNGVQVNTLSTVCDTMTKALLRH